MRVEELISYVVFVDGVLFCHANGTSRRRTSFNILEREGGGGFKWTVFLGVCDAIQVVGFDFSFDCRNDRLADQMH